MSVNEAKIIFELKKQCATKKKVDELLEKYQVLRYKTLIKYDQLRGNALKELHKEFNRELKQLSEQI